LRNGTSLSTEGSTFKITPGSDGAVGLDPELQEEKKITNGMLIQK